MIVTDKYTNLISEYETLYNETYNTDYYGQFPIIVSDDLLNDIATYAIDETERTNILNSNNMNGSTLIPYSTRKEPHIFLSEWTLNEQEGDTRLNSTFFHEYTHAIHYKTLFEKINWDFSMRYSQYLYHDAFLVWSEFYSYYNGVYFLNLLANNKDIDTLKKTVSTYHKSMFKKYISMFNENDSLKIEIVHFLARYYMLDTINHQVYKNGRAIPDDLCTHITKKQLQTLYKMLLKLNNLDRLLSGLDVFDSTLKHLHLIV